MFKPSLAAAAVVAVLVSGALLMSRPSQPVIGGPSPAVGLTPSPSQRTPTPSPQAEVSPPAVQSLDLTWTKVATDVRPTRIAWLGDRFVMVDGDSGAVSTSTDGASWHVLQQGDPDPGYFDLLRGSFATWQNDVVGWWNPEDEHGPDIAGKPPVTARDVLRIVRPPAAPTESTPFKGRIESIGIGPVGIVAQVHSHLDWDAWVATKLGADWVSRYKGVDFKDGILQITMKQGRGLKVVWADQGFEPGDYQDAGFGWYSPDGEHWTLMPAEAPSPEGDGVRGFLTGFGDVVGVSDGFIARGDSPEDSCPLPDGCGEMWHSSDGVTWRNLGAPAGDRYEGTSAPEVLPWNGGALVTDGVGGFDFWTSEGHTELPMAPEVRAAWKQPEAGFGTGPLGIVTVLKDDGEILVTHDGVDWDIQPMPAEMAADSTLFYGTPSVAVGDRSVVVVMWSGTQEARVPSVWVGTPKP